MKKTLFVLFAVMLSTFVVAQQPYDLSDYPMPFVRNGNFDGVIVVGQNAATSDVIGAVDVAASLVAESGGESGINRITGLFDSRLGVLDVDAPEIGSELMIVVGGPCANAVAAELLDYPVPCHADFEVGKAKIRYFPEQKALLVAGYDAQETLAASYVLADHDDYDLRGEQLEITIAGQGVLSINSVG